MELFLLGMSHRTSPVELRERLSVDAAALPEELDTLRREAGATETVLLTTCNRVEVYLSADGDRAIAGRVRAWLDARAGQAVGSYLYERMGAEAVTHAFRVASSLDSMVVGEPQILGQLKDAFAASKRQGAVGALLDRCFTHAFAVAKRVRHETQIAAGSVSISSVACDLAEKIFGDIAGRRALLLGAGDMAEAAARHLADKGASLYVLNRSPERAQRLAQTFGGHARSLDELESELALADVVLCSTSSPQFVVTPELMKGVVRARRHRPLFLIDIAVPRDVDPRTGQMDNVFLYDVDDLEQIANEHQAARHDEAKKAERIVEAEVVNFERWRATSTLKPTIIALRGHVETLLRGELQRTVPRLSSASDADQAALERMVQAMVNKVVHAPISALKAHAGTTDGALLSEILEELFALEVASKKEGGAASAGHAEPGHAEPAANVKYRAKTG